MKKCLFFVLIFLFCLTFNSHAVVLCQPANAYTCPILTNISTNGDSYYPRGSCVSSETCYTPSTDGSWTATGPWGSGTANITINGDSRCSTTVGSYPDNGNPVPGSGSDTYCWCRFKTSSGAVGAWAYLNGISNCASSCAANCANNAYTSSAYRAALCSGAISFPSDYRVAESTCPGGYTPVTSGTFNGGNFTDEAGTFDVHCAEY
jgi:hypothetical protein